MLAIVTLPQPAGIPWFALRCLGDPSLRAIPCLKQLGVETYYPVVREMHRVPRRRLSHAQRSSGAVLMRPRVVSFLPGTVFIQFPPGFARAGELFDLPSILGLLSIGETPAAFADAEICKLRAREVGGVIAGRTPARMIFRVGDQVRVTHGPLSTFPGIIEQVPDVAIEDIDGDTRLKLAVEIFGRATAVELSAWQIEKI